ncbi:hypothetical protein cypCar_00039665, partial [Cyprinus carpio]
MMMKVFSAPQNPNSSHISKEFLYPALRQKLAAFTVLGVTESHPV